MACTFWPERIGKWDFRRACRLHDVAYNRIEGFGWRAYLQRLEADSGFAQDLLDDDIPPLLVGIMYAGVRRFGGYARMFSAIKRRIKQWIS